MQVFAVEQDAVFSVFNDFAYTARVDGDRGDAGGHGFDEHKSLGFGFGGECEDVESGICIDESFAFESAYGEEAVLEAMFGECCFDLAEHGSFSYYHEAACVVPSDELGDSACKEREVFLFCESADVSDDEGVVGYSGASSKGGGGSFCEKVKIDSGGYGCDWRGDSARDE